MEEWEVYLPYTAACFVSDYLKIFTPDGSYPY